MKKIRLGVVRSDIHAYYLGMMLDKCDSVLLQKYSGELQRFKMESIYRKKFLKHCVVSFILSLIFFCDPVPAAIKKDSKLGLAGSWKIVIGTKPDIVETTASNELAILFKAIKNENVSIEIESSFSELSYSIIIGTTSSSNAIKTAQEKGFFKNLDINGSKDDAFEIVSQGNTIYIAGQNPRGVLYGVYYLDEYMRKNKNSLPGNGWHIYKKPVYRDRVSVAYNNLKHIYEKEDVRYLSKCGYNQMFLNWWGIPLGGWGMAAWTDSEVFPSIKDVDNIKKIQGFLNNARLYGIEGVFYFCEPQPLNSYDTQTVNNLGGQELLGKSGDRTTTCVNSPVIRKHYVSMVKNLVRDFPEVNKIFIYENDGSFNFCNAKQCERCRNSLKNAKPPYSKHNWELTTNFINLLQESANEVRRDFTVVGTAYHYINVMDEYIGNLVPGTEVLAAAHNSDGWAYIFITPDMQAALKRVVESAKKHNIPAGAVDEISRSEKLGFAPGCPWPYSTWQKLNAYANVGFSGFCDYAPIPNVQGINPIVLREYIWDPNHEPDTLLGRIAADQFGEKAGPKMLEAWKEMKLTFETYAKPGTSFWSTYLMTGNLFTQFGMFRPLTIEGMRTHPDQYYSGGSNPNSYAHFKLEMRNEEAMEQMEEACSHIRRAVELAKEAVDLSPDNQHPFYSSYYYPERNITCREYAMEQYHSLNFNRYIFEDNLAFLKTELLVRAGKEDEAHKMILHERELTEDILRTSVAYMTKKIGLLHDAAARLTPYEILGDRHPVVEKLKQKLYDGEAAQEQQRKTAP